MKYILIITLILFLPIYAYAQSSFIHVDTDKSHYDSGDQIVVTGNVKSRISNTPITLRVIYDDNMIHISQIDVAKDSSFIGSIIADGPGWRNNGTYIIDVFYGTHIAETSIEFQTTAFEKNQIYELNVNDEYNNILIPYTITNGKVLDMVLDQDNLLLDVIMKAYENGSITINLVRDLIDSKDEGDDNTFIVLVDGNEVNFEETTTTADRTLKIPFPDGAEEIEIIGTFVVPEFGSIAIFILAIAVTSIVVMTTRSRFNMFARY